MKKDFIAFVISFILFFSTPVYGGWCDWFHCADDCKAKLVQAEKDKIWLWNQLVACRKQLPSKPYPQPTSYIEISSNEIHQILISMDIVGLDEKYSDTSYKAIPKLEFEGWLQYNGISEIDYEPSDFDCDDFAQQTVANAKMWFNGLAIAEIWIYKRDNTGAHAIICIVHDDRKLYFYEPQSDGAWNKLDEWEPGFIKFDVPPVTAVDTQGNESP